MLLPAYGGVTGWAALRWAGGLWFDGAGARRPDATAGRAERSAATSREQRGGAGVRGGPRTREDLTELDGLRDEDTGGRVLLRDAVRPVAAGARWPPSTWPCDDDLVRRRARGVRRRAPRWTGIPRCRDAIALADENSWSPRETTCAWSGRRRGLPRPLCNVAGLRGGRAPGTPDCSIPVGRRGGRVRRRAAPRRRAAAPRRGAGARLPRPGWSTSPCSPATPGRQRVHRALAACLRTCRRHPPRAQAAGGWRLRAGGSTPHGCGPARAEWTLAREAARSPGGVGADGG